MPQIAYTEIGEYAVHLTESGLDQLPSWELRVYDIEGVEVYWASQFSIDSAIKEYARKVGDLLWESRGLTTSNP
jgi:hypothetical protein